jgi:hypothetical protein
LEGIPIFRVHAAAVRHTCSLFMRECIEEHADSLQT